MCATTSLLEGRRRQGRCSISRATAPASIPRLTWPITPGSSRLTLMKAMASFTSHVRSWKPACWVYARRPFFVMADSGRERPSQGARQETGGDLAAGAGSGPPDRQAVRDRAGDPRGNYDKRVKAAGRSAATQLLTTPLNLAETPKQI